MSEMETLAQISQYVENHKKDFIEDWLQLVRMPSVSATGEGVAECCDWIVAKMKKLGISTVKRPLSPFPLIEGRCGSDPAKKTVLIYAHYDVKPAGDLSLWRTPPFEPTISDGRVYARGSADNKSPLMAHLEALSFYTKYVGALPVNLIFLFEGCEEEGSKGLADYLKKKRDRYKADLVFFSDGSKDPSGLPIIALGAKGVLGLTLKVRTLKKNVHSRYAPVLPNAAWRLVELLNKLKTGDTVHIPGFYDGIIPPSKKELDILKGLPDSSRQLEEMYGASVTLYGQKFYDRLNNTPTFNISSITSGAAGVVPAAAEARIDVRLVAGQTPLDMEKKIKNYISSLGYDDVEVLCEGGVEPSKTDINTPYLPVVEEATRAIYGNYVVYPCRPSTAPDYLWTNVLQLPAIQVRWSDADSDNHAPNEHLSIQEYLDGIRLTAYVISKIAAQ